MSLVQNYLHPKENIKERNKKEALLVSTWWLTLNIILEVVTGPKKTCFWASRSGDLVRPDGRTRQASGRCRRPGTTLTASLRLHCCWHMLLRTQKGSPECTRPVSTCHQSRLAWKTSPGGGRASNHTFQFSEATLSQYLHFKHIFLNINAIHVLWKMCESTSVPRGELQPSVILLTSQR